MTVSPLSDLANGKVDPNLLHELAQDVAAVEAALSKEVDSRVGIVRQVGELTLHAGGKRLRPAFVALAAKATGLEFEQERVVTLGACMEMIHMATLIHDDVIDNAATRRGKPTASSVFGNTPSILSGDVLLAKAMVLLAQDGDLAIIRAVSSAVVEIAEGEVRELECRGDFDLEEEPHLEVLRMKTAAFIECCCEVGAMVAGADRNVRAALKRFGYHVGMAFQIIDDLLDYRGDRRQTGKPMATDFREGQATLPLIYLRPLLSESECDLTRRKFGNGVTEEEIRMISDWMGSRGAFGRAEALAQSHIADALKAAEDLPDNPSRQLLRSVADFVVQRQA